MGIFFLRVNCNKPFETSVSFKNKGLFLASTECPLQVEGLLTLDFQGSRLTKAMGQNVFLPSLWQSRGQIETYSLA